MEENEIQKKDRIKQLFSDESALLNIEFYNRSSKIKTLWVEPSCEEIELESNTEFKIITHDKYIRFEYTSDDYVILYLDCAFGFILYKRPSSEEIPNLQEWELVFDNSDNN